MSIGFFDQVFKKSPIFKKLAEAYRLSAQKKKPFPQNGKLFSKNDPPSFAFPAARQRIRRSAPAVKQRHSAGRNGPYAVSFEFLSHRHKAFPRFLFF